MTLSDQIKHLYWRSGFGVDYETVELPQERSLEELVDDLFNKEYIYLKSSPEQDLKNPKKKDYVSGLSAAWIEHMIASKIDLREKMSLFWHDHFACSSRNNAYLESYLNTIRKNALGSFKDLIHGISKEPAMIIYLNNQQNVKGHPNENFARELMELFCFGRDVLYTEYDIKEAARSFTGWRVNEGQFQFNKSRHDFGTKSFLGKRGDYNGNEIIDIILEKREVAYFLCEKIYKFFVNRKSNFEFINLMTDEFFQSNYDIKHLMQFLFKSEEFYNTQNIASKIKSPMELLVGLCKTLRIKQTSRSFYKYVQLKLGQKLFFPPNVAGWPSDEKWITASNLLIRLRLGEIMLNGSELNYNSEESIDINDKFNVPNKFEIESIIDWEKLEEEYGSLSDSALLNALLQAPITITNLVQKDLKSKLEFVTNLPEFQIC